MLAQLDLDKIQNIAFPTFLYRSGGQTMPFGRIITNILPYIFAAAAIALLVYLILGGFQLMTSRGDPKAAQGAQAKITNAVIGFIVIIFAYFIVQIFGQIFGLQNTIFGQIFK